MVRTARLLRKSMAAALLAGLVACATGMPGAGGVTSAQAAPLRLKPSSHGGVLKVVEGKKSRTYYKASKAQPVQLSLQGPITFRVIGRRLQPASGQMRLRLDLDGVQARELKLSAKLAKNAALKGGARLGAMARLVFKVPAGSHQVRIYPAAESGIAAVRILSGIGSKQVRKRVPFAPETYEKAARLQGRDSETTWYRFSAAQPVGLSVQGPLHLRISTRLDFGPTNGTTQSYVIKTQLDGKPWTGYSLKSRASHTVTYPEFSEITPGMARDFTLEIPSGFHRISLLLDGTTATGAAVQVTVPAKELKVKPKRGSAGGLRIGMGG